MRGSGYRRPSGRRSINSAFIVIIAVTLSGCASRPGPELLTPVAALPGDKPVQIYVATTRERQSPSGNVFTAHLSPALNFAKFAVSVPPNHRPGMIELPANPPDPQTSFAIVDQAVLTEADFRNAVAPRGGARRKRHKVFVFVHGFNNNFQESLFRMTQLQADAKVDGIPILFAWPSQAQVIGYEADKAAAIGSRDQLAALLTMLTASPEVGDILLVGHSMGGMLTMETLRQLRSEGKNQVIARLNRVVLAAPDIDAQVFRSQVQALGPLKPPLLVLVSKDDGALRFSTLLGGTGAVRAGALDVDNPIIQEAALQARVQVVDISRLASHDDLHHDQFVSVAVLYTRLQHNAAAYRNTAGTFVFNQNGAAMVQPVNVGSQALAVPGRPDFPVE
jgi:esterase/lipase superfamily enzyme